MAQVQVAPNSVSNRQELKERMSKTQFSFGMVNENTGMKRAQTLYSSEIDKQAKKGGDAADGRSVIKNLKKTNFTIGTQPESLQNAASEAHAKFVGHKSSSNKATAEQREKNLHLAAKLKGHNFSFKEHKQGGMVNNYFQTSHNQTFNAHGNPNAIRSRIPEQ